MDRLHVATLNIRNLADRWDERLPLLLADFAALQPDLMGLQEVVYVLQQDRVIGAAGAGEYRAIRGWAGRPEYGNAMLVRAGLEPTEIERLDLGHDRSAPANSDWGSRRGVGFLFAVTHLHHPVDGASQRRDQAAALLAWLDAAPSSDAQVVVGDFNADPSEPAYARMTDGRFPLGLPRGQRQRARGDLAVRAPGAGHGHRRRPGLPGLHLAPRRGRRRRMSARLRPPGGGRPDALPVRPLRARGRPS